MALQAYVFIVTKQSETWKVAEEIRKCSEVKEAHCVSGTYDVIARSKVADLPALADFLTTRVYILPGVQRTLSNIIVD